MSDRDPKAKTAEGKVPLSEIPLDALFGVARVLAYGVRKYSKDSYLQCPADVATERYVSAALRHLTSVLNDVVHDEESGLPHLDHAICSLIMLRRILNRADVLAEDPGIGNPPPKKVAR